MGKKSKPQGKRANLEAKEVVPGSMAIATLLQSAAIVPGCQCCSTASYPSKTYSVTYQVQRPESHGQHERGHHKSTLLSSTAVQQRTALTIRITPVPNPIFTTGVHLSYIQAFVTFQLFPAPGPNVKPAPWHSRQAWLTLHQELCSRLDFARLQALRGGERVGKDVITAAVAREAIQAAKNAESGLMSALTAAEYVSEEDVAECQEHLAGSFEANEGKWTRAWDRRAYDAGVEWLLGCNFYRWRELRRLAQDGF